ncbi:hypothetical protein MLD38_023740 [Melastoma candidum]|uniref:Uncharacterized protein n=1 Tax=Melastoma candidum TaxID=119954 RepID=A0ACB9NV32_9MYRT|nr:hypothetical protein MLD38_023740 [Melastoma candidum]
MSIILYYFTLTLFLIPHHHLSPSSPSVPSLFVLGADRPPPKAETLSPAAPPGRSLLISLPGWNRGGHASWGQLLVHWSRDYLLQRIGSELGQHVSLTRQIQRFNCTLGRSRPPTTYRDQSSTSPSESTTTSTTICTNASDA